MTYKSLTTLIITALFSWAATANEPQIKFTTLAEIVNQSLTNSDSLRAQKQSEKVAESQVAIAQTGYYPTVNAEALDSTGFPGSSSAAGVSGLMGSPYRSGFSYGLTASETIFDFGTTAAAMDVAKKSFAAQKSRSQISQWNVQQKAIDLYYACARAQTQANLWSEVEVDSRSVQKEVEKFVHTGQRSVVDGLLAKAQTEESARAKGSYSEQVAVLVSRLSVLSGLPNTKIACPDLFSAGFVGVVSAESASTKSNPYIAQAEMEKAVAESRVSQAQSGYRPKLIAIGSVGDMQNVRLVDKSNYSLGVGLVIPLFDGLKTPREVSSAHAYQEQKEQEVGAAHQFVDDANLKFDQLIRSDRSAIDHFRQELIDSDNAFKTARKRYISFTGSLVDVRESIRNFSRLRAEFVDVQADWQRALSLKAAFNGQEF